MNRILNSTTIVIFLTLLLSLNGCNITTVASTDEYATVASNDEYSVITRDEQYYIRFHAHTTPPKLPDGYSITFLDTTPVFSSLQEMKEAIFTGNIPNDYYGFLLYVYNGKREIPICNLDINYDISLPLGWRKEKVLWHRAYYSYRITDGTHDGLLSDYQTDEDLFSQILERDLALYASQENVHVRDIAERNATVYEVSDRDIVCYKINTENKNITVMEYYDHPGYVEGGNITPNEIAIYISENNKHYYIRLNQLSCRPKIEWLQSFGLKNHATE